MNEVGSPRAVPVRTPDGSVVLYQQVFGERYVTDEAVDLIVHREEKERVWTVCDAADTPLLLLDGTKPRELLLRAASGEVLGRMVKQPVTNVWSIHKAGRKEQELGKARTRILDEVMGVKMTGEAGFRVETHDPRGLGFIVYRNAPAADEPRWSPADMGDRAAERLRSLVTNTLTSITSSVRSGPSGGSASATGEGDGGSASGPLPKINRLYRASGPGGSGGAAPEVLRLASMPRVQRPAALVTTPHSFSFIKDGDAAQFEATLLRHVVATIRVLPGMDAALAFCLAAMYDVSARDRRPQPTNKPGNWFADLGAWQAAYPGCLLNKWELEPRLMFRSFYPDASPDSLPPVLSPTGAGHEPLVDLPPPAAPDSAASSPALLEAADEARRKPRRSHSVGDIGALAKQFSTIMEIDELHLQPVDGSSAGGTVPSPAPAPGMVPK